MDSGATGGLDRGVGCGLGGSMQEDGTSLGVNCHAALEGSGSRTLPSSPERPPRPDPRGEGGAPRFPPSRRAGARRGSMSGETMPGVLPRHEMRRQGARRPRPGRRPTRRRPPLPIDRLLRGQIETPASRLVPGPAPPLDSMAAPSSLLRGHVSAERRRFRDVAELLGSVGATKLLNVDRRLEGLRSHFRVLVWEKNGEKGSDRPLPIAIGLGVHIGERSPVGDTSGPASCLPNGSVG